METDPALARRAGVVLSLFLLLCTAIVVYLFTGTPASVPLLEKPRDYEVAITVQDADNLVPAGQVRIAGVEVGEVRSTTPTPEGIRVVMAFDEVAVPLHEGATVRVGARSVVQETYLEVTDGTGAPLPSGTLLPADAVQRSVQIRDILYKLGPQNRAELGTFFDSLGAGTMGTEQDIDAIFTGFGKLGREGHTALDAIAAQSDALRKVVAETAVLTNALDTSEGAIGRLVSNARMITDATAGQRPAIEASVRKLPGVLDSAKTATADLTVLAGALGPVAANLEEAGPALSEALQELPPTTEDLRDLLPALNDVLDRAPATLDRVPEFGEATRSIDEPTDEILREVNPIVEYARPYGPELGAFFANFNAVLGYRGENGVHNVRAFIPGNEYSFQSPVDYSLRAYKNPYPKPGTGLDPGPFDRDYPHVERAPR